MVEKWFIEQMSRSQLLRLLRSDDRHERLVLEKFVLSIPATPSRLSAAAFPLDPLVATKLLPPPSRSALLPRQLLVTAVSRGAQCALTLVAAPAGAGKTTLLATWMRTRPHPVAWLSLDEDDSEPARFWSSVIAALQTVDPFLGDAALAQLRVPGPVTLDCIVTMLINDLASRNGDVVLVLDDYHTIENAATHQSVTFFLDRLPANVHLILLTRVMPPLPLARLRARGQLVELTAADFRLHQTEVAALLRDVLALPLSDADIATLAARTDGWVAGLQLAALALRGHPDPSRFVQRLHGGQGAIADYLLDEVLARQPADVQAFLLHTALLERLCAPVCIALTGRDDSQHLLCWLETANLFLLPLDEERRWYRYHPLFAEALRARLARDSAGEVRVLHRRASAWYLAEGLTVEAVPHLLGAGDIEHAADVIACVAEPLILRGEAVRVRRWLEQLPATLIRARPELCLVQVHALLTLGQFAALTPYLRVLTAADGVVEAGDRTPDEQGQPLQLTAIQTLLATAQDLDPLAQQALQEGLRAAAAGAAGASSAELLDMAFAAWSQGDFQLAGPLLERVVEASEAQADPATALTAACFLADIDVEEGALRQAAERYETILRQIEASSDPHSPIVSLPAIGLASMLYEWNELDTASRLVERGLACGASGGRPDVLLAGTLLTARLHQAHGEAEAARCAMERAVQLARETRLPRLLAYAEAQQADLWCSQGDLDRASAWARGRGLGVDDPLVFLQKREYLTFARILTTTGDPQRALSLLGRLHDRAAAAGHAGRQLAVLLGRACAEQVTGAWQAAQETVTQALVLARPGGYLRSFIDAGPVIYALLAELQPPTSRDRAALERILRAWEAEAIPAGAASPFALADRMNTAPSASAVASRATNQPPTSAPSSSLTLSERELAVLRLLVDGRSNREIGLALGLGEKAIERRVSELCAKLGVTTRVAAAVKAVRDHLV
jgi:LuxR family maltose regulon positive regulatory protein